MVGMIKLKRTSERRPPQNKHRSELHARNSHSAATFFLFMLESQCKITSHLGYVWTLELNFVPNRT